MAAMATGDIREGFLCPICMRDFGTVSQLQEHFEEAHSSEDKAVFQQLKGFFDKAKKKILGEKEHSFGIPVEGSHGESSYKSLSYLSGYDPTWWEGQDLGVTRRHTDMFKGIRDARIDHFVIETNKLLIRLDKLTQGDLPTDPNKRKAFERSIVPWIPDSEVPACLNCERSFSIMRRRHHCRLCGGIMCDKCSQFLTLAYAQKLVNPAYNFSGESGFLRRSGSSSSLNSIVGSDGEQHMRVCTRCRLLLERRDQMTEQRNTKTQFVLLYEKMKECIKQAEEILPEYHPMLESLSAGEAAYSYQQAQVLRTKLARLYDVIDQLSKRILLLGQDQEGGVQGKQAVLQRAVRQYASAFLQEHLLGLQALPEEEEYNRLQEARKREVQRRIALERQQAMMAQEREREKQEETSPSHRPKGDPHLGHRRQDSSGRPPPGQGENGERGVGHGWKPAEEAPRVADVEDPMVQQMEIIRGYIRQAKQAQCWDEVQMLEANLKDLQLEHRRQQQQQHQQHQQQKSGQPPH